VDLLFGLDMLKTHQACIDLERNVLRIQGREVRFLSEHELPDKARYFGGGEEEADSKAGSSFQRPSSVSGQPSNNPSFPGSGNTLGTSPGARMPAQPSGSATAATRHSEEAIETLMSLGATREVAISSLDAAGGNLDVAASLLF
jgi:DNA damage-inducible protein 1